MTANAYYVHPIIARVAEDFDISAAMIGMVPAFNQIALAIGIFLLLPLGDRMSNRRIASLCVAGQVIALMAMVFAEDYRIFVAGSTVLGFFTVTPYLLPAYVSKRTAPGSLGHATAVLTTGVIAGILIARVGAGFIGEQFGWRNVYYVATGLMIAVSFALPLIMEEREKEKPPQGSYFDLLRSIAPIVRSHPEILFLGTIQALSFGIFLSVWMGLGLHLTSPQMGYGVDVVGYLAVISIFNLATTPRLGAWADRVGAPRARVVFSGIQLFGVSLLLFFGSSLWLLIIPIIVMTLVGPMVDITGRMTFLSEAAEIRTRLMTVYIVLMFSGGGMASWAGTAAYDWGGWLGNAGLALLLSVLVFSLSLWRYRWPGWGKRDR